MRRRRIQFILTDQLRIKLDTITFFHKAFYRRDFSRCLSTLMNLTCNGDYQTQKAA